MYAAPDSSVVAVRYPSPFGGASANPTANSGGPQDDFLDFLDTIVPTWPHETNVRACDRSPTSGSLTESGSLGDSQDLPQASSSPSEGRDSHANSEWPAMDLREDIRNRNRQAQARYRAKKKKEREQYKERREEILREMDLAHSEHKLLTSDVLIGEKLLQTRNEMLEVLQLGRNVHTSVELPAIVMEPGMTYGQGIMFETACMKAALMDKPTLQGRDLDDFKATPSPVLFSSIKKIRDDIEHAMDARDRLEALRSPEFVERVELQVMHLLTKKTILIWRMAKYRPGEVVNVFGADYLRPLSGADGHSIARQIRLGPKRAAQFDALVHWTERAMERIMTNRARIVEELLESRKKLVLGTGAEATHAALELRVASLGLSKSMEDEKKVYHAIAIKLYGELFSPKQKGMVCLESFPFLPDILEIYDQMKQLHYRDPLRLECPESLGPETTIFCEPTELEG